MKILLSSFFILLLLQTYSQSLKDSLFSGKLKTDSGKIISSNHGKDSLNFSSDKSETLAYFPGGIKEWQNYIAETGDSITNEAMRRRIKRGVYRIIISFIVGQDGQLIEIDINVNPANKFLKESFFRAMEVAPKWVPASQNGRYIKYFQQQPLTIHIS